MNGFNKIIIILATCSAAAFAWADIYEWTDENGVKHYSNYAPPAESKVLLKTKEEPYDEAADRARMEADRQARLEMARLEIAQRESELESREAEANRRLAEAGRLADDALREAEYYRVAAENSSRITYRGGGGGFWCGDYVYGCTYARYDRWYYRDKYRNSYRKPHRYNSYNRLKRLSPYQRDGYVKKHDRGRKNYSGHKFRERTLHRKKGRDQANRLRSYPGRKYGYTRSAAGSNRHRGQGAFSRIRSGFGKRR